MVAVWASRDGHAFWSGRSLEDWVPSLIEEIVDIVDPVAVWLFGSVARGDDGADSDIDLLVVLSEFDPATTLALKRRVLGTSTFRYRVHRLSKVRGAAANCRDLGTRRGARRSRFL